MNALRINTGRSTRLQEKYIFDGSISEEEIQHWIEQLNSPEGRTQTATLRYTTNSPKLQKGELDVVIKEVQKYPPNKGAAEGSSLVIIDPNYSWRVKVRDWKGNTAMIGVLAESKRLNLREATYGFMKSLKKGLY